MGRSDTPPKRPKISPWVPDYSTAHPVLRVMGRDVSRPSPSLRPWRCHLVVTCSKNGSSKPIIRHQLRSVAPNPNFCLNATRFLAEGSRGGANCLQQMTLQYSNNMLLLVQMHNYLYYEPTNDEPENSQLFHKLSHSYILNVT